MQFSAPIYVLKQKAKRLAQETPMPLHQALDRIAMREGYQSWSHLSASAHTESPAKQILQHLRPGDLCLIGARPGQGKTRLGLELAARASRIGRAGYFFTLDYHARDVAEQFTAMHIDPSSAGVVVDTSDDVSADYITARLSAAKGPALIVVDYLQLLDQKRTNPSLDCQMSAFRSYLNDAGDIALIISQIDRRFDLAGKPMPDISDIRQPNPFDLSVFSKCVFLHDGEVRIVQAA
ncbi:MAG: DNA helicase [Pseudomonadota bacterium]